MQLIKTSAELTDLVPVSKGLSIDSLKPFLTDSEAETEIINILGETTYLELLNQYDSGVLVDEYIDLHPIAAKAIANLSIYYFLQLRTITISDGGPQQLINREKAIYQWQQNKAEKAFLKAAYNQIDKLLDFMEANSSSFPNWKTDSQFANLKQFFINETLTYQRYVSINNSRRTFVALWPSILDVEEGRVRSVLSDDLYVEIKNEIKVGNISPDNQTLLRFIKPAVAFLSISQGIFDTSMEVTANGSFVYSIDSNASNISSEKEADIKRLELISKRNQEKGDSWLEKLREFLNENASSTKYTSYFESNNYEDPNVVDPKWQQNTESNTFNAL